MAPTIEANSLLDTTKLADDPPLNPGDVDFQSIQTPLVLYIARVPGTNDIFLTTMKPLQKAVTAQDVQSCLYYVHLDSLEDEKLLQPSDQDGYAVEQSNELVNLGGGRMGSVKRKPLPPAHASAPAKSLEMLAGEASSPQLPVRGLNRLSVKSATTTASLDTSATITTGALHGPRPMQSRLHTTARPESQQHDANSLDANPRRWSEQPNLLPPELPPRPDWPDVTTKDLITGRFDHAQDGVDHISPPGVMRFRQEKSNGFRRAEPKQDYDRDKSLTLIRRYDGLQANIGKIVHSNGRSKYPTGPETIARSPSPSSETLIEISTPGYRKFIRPSVEQSFGPHQCQDLRLMPQPSSGDRDMAATDGYESTGLFRRQLHTLSTRKRPPTQDRLGSSTSSGGYLGSRSSLEVPRYGDRYSQQLPADRDLNGPFSLPRPDSLRPAARGHIIESPWNGICEFRTGIAGRSLKCTHTSPASVQSAAVSELRFNLPSSSALGPPRTHSSSDTTQHWKRSSIFHNRAHSSSYVPTSSPSASKVELEDRMDMSLGQERAGGGFRGKQAKLGKLIIEQEGLKMLDLIVAANVALWWRVFEISLQP